MSTAFLDQTQRSTAVASITRGIFMACVVAVLPLGAIAASSTTAATEPGALCEAMAAFANASEGLERHSVALVTDWGGEFSKEPVLFTKRCEAAGYEPGKRLCAYLLPNTRTEFAMDNYFAARRCLGLKGPSRPPAEGDEEDEPGIREWSVAVPGVRPGIRLDVEFYSRTVAEPATLKIHAQRVSD